MPPPGYEPFLNAICADPADDIVRLVYADWLDENGDPARAEFIRLQIQRAQLKAGGKNPKGLKARDIRLRSEHEKRWRWELPPDIHSNTWQRFWRGFVSGVDIEARKFHTCADAIFAAAPIQFARVRRLTDDRAAAFGTSPHLRQLHGLTLSEEQLDFGWLALFGAGNLSNLRWLEVRSRSVLLVDAARVLASQHQLDRVEIKGAVSRAAATVLGARFGPNASWHRQVERSHTVAGE